MNKQRHGLGAMPQKPQSVADRFERLGRDLDKIPASGRIPEGAEVFYSEELNRMAFRTADRIIDVGFGDWKPEETLIL